MDLKTEKKDFLKWKNKKKRKQAHLNINRANTKKPWQVEAEKIETLQKLYEKFDSSKTEEFGDFPLSPRTKAGLRQCSFSKPTAIQKAAILPALQGKDVLGAAKTGSGKTLAFIIPLLECLYRHRWSSMDGPGALVISPTRELALQIFDVLRKVGCKHDFSAGLVIGGKDLKDETEKVCKTNIVVCTPGRLLQHLDTTSYFKLENLKILVLDEADRLLDMGFSTTINAIIENLPSEHQTLLFSATQTKSVKDLARLSLFDPVYVAVHAESRCSTPSGLKQRYTVCNLSDKINVLYSFVRNHVKTKTLVFLSSCKQVRYLFNALSRLRPGIPVMHLHGRMNQTRRMSVYEEFCRKKFALLVATDIAARGLDFPSINWVVQLDCPEDVETYIHRVGRTARFHDSGNALLILIPSEEEKMLEKLLAKKVPISKSEINTGKLTRVDQRLQSFCAEEQELKEQAKRCFAAYIRSVHLMKDKSVFVVKDLPLDDFASSLGLAFAPRLRFLQKSAQNKQKINAQTDISSLTESGHNVEVISSTKTENVSKSELISTLFDVSGDETDLISVKKGADAFDRFHVLDGSESEGDKKDEIMKKKKSKAQEAKRLLRKGVKVNQKILFGEEGDVTESWPPLEDATQNSLGRNIEGGINIHEAKEEMRKRDILDREKHRKKIAAKHREARLKAKEERRKIQSDKEKRRFSDVEDGDDADMDASLGSSDDAEEDSCDHFSNDAASSNSDSDDYCTEAIKPKRKKLDETGVVTLNTLSKDFASMDSGMSLQEEEDLVLQLLQSKR